MQGESPIAIAVAIMGFLGGGGGGALLACAIMLTGLFAAFHVCSGERVKQTAMYGSLAWAAAFIVGSVLGWSVG